MSDKKTIILAIIISLGLIASGFVYQQIKKPKASNSPRVYPGILVGDPKAPLTIQEYFNFLCPACAHFHQETYPKIETDYILTGKVNFEFFIFPPYEAAQAGLCANQQGKFIPFSSVVFKKQSQIKKLSDFVDLAKEAGLNKEKFKQCLNSQADLEKIKGWYKQGTDNGISGTPTFFIGDKQSVIPGSYDFSIFKDLIEKKLN